MLGLKFLLSLYDYYFQIYLLALDITPQLVSVEEAKWRLTKLVCVACLIDRLFSYS